MEDIENEYSKTKQPRFFSFTGYVTKISSVDDCGCVKMFTVSKSPDQIVNFTVTRNTYFFNNLNVHVGTPIIGFYDSKAPAILIYPPQFEAVVMARNCNWITVKVDYFNEELLSNDEMLKINISEQTEVLLLNGQTYTGDLGGKNLIVGYTFSTKSIPAQTTPETVIVMC